MQVHEIDSAEAKISLRCLQLVLQEVWMHAVNVCSNVLFCYLSKKVSKMNSNWSVTYFALFNELLCKHRSALTVIRIVRYVSILAANEKLVSLYTMLLE